MTKKNKKETNDQQIIKITQLQKKPTLLFDYLYDPKVTLSRQKEES